MILFEKHCSFKRKKKKKIENELDLKKYCVGLYWNTSLDNKLVDEVEAFCSDALTTRKARIIGKGLLTEGKFLKEDDEFKVAFALNRYTKEFIDLINNFSKKEHNKETKAQDAFDDYKNFCETKLKENEDINLQAIAKICEKKGWKTAQQKLEVEGRSFLKKEQFKAKFEELKKLKDMEGNTLLKDLQNETNDWKTLKNNEQDFKDRLEKWCNEQKVKNLFDEGFYPDTYSKLRTRCTEDAQKL